MVGYPGHCPCKPKALVEAVIPKMRLRSRKTRPGNLTLLLPPNWLQAHVLADSSAELSLSRGNKRKGGQGHREPQSRARGL